MAERPLPPVPNTPLVADPSGDAIWKRWLETLWRRLTMPGVIDHNTLANLQGGTTDEYYHLTAAQHTTVTNMQNISDIQAFAAAHG